MTVRTVNIVKPLPGKSRELVEILTDVAAMVRSQTGCTSWSVWEDAGVFVVMGEWETVEALEQSTRSRESQDVVSRIQEAGVLDAPPLSGRLVLAKRI